MNATNEKLLALLIEARAVLDKHWFYGDSEEEYNDDEVIDVSKKIDAFLDTL